MSKLTTAQLVEAVKTHAIENYEQGWDVIVECYEDAEIAELIGRVTTINGAIAKVAPVVELRAEVRADLYAAAGLDQYGNEPGEAVEEPKRFPLVTILVEDAKSVDLLMQGYYEFPEATSTGIVCGQCSKSERDRTGDRKAQVRHASTEHVRYCFGTRAAMDAETAAEMAAERAATRYFEGADRFSAEDVEEDARERWLMSLQD